MVYPIGRRIIFPFISLWFKKKGLENLPKKGPFIISANHSSYMDHFGLGLSIVMVLNRKIHFIAKKEHFESFFQKMWHNYASAIPIDRESSGKDALNFAIKMLKEGAIIGIYPEGTRSLDGRLQRGKTGVAQLALTAKVPVIPVGVMGTFDILPKGKYIPKFKKAVINIGKPMYFQKYYNKKINKKILRKVTNRIMEKIARLSKQKYSFT